MERIMENEVATGTFELRRVRVSCQHDGFERFGHQQNGHNLDNPPVMVPRAICMWVFSEHESYTIGSADAT